MAESKSTLSNGVEHPPKDPSPSPSSAQSNREAQSETAAEIVCFRRSLTSQLSHYFE